MSPAGTSLTNFQFDLIVAPNDRGLQALDEIGDVNVTTEDFESPDDGQAGHRWTVSFTALGNPAHIGDIQVRMVSCANCGRKHMFSVDRVWKAVVTAFLTH